MNKRNAIHQLIAYALKISFNKIGGKWISLRCEKPRTFACAAEEKCDERNNGKRKEDIICDCTSVFEIKQLIFSIIKVNFEV